MLIDTGKIGISFVKIYAIEIMALAAIILLLMYL
jgi:hypothetical protein